MCLLHSRSLHRIFILEIALILLKNGKKYLFHIIFRHTIQNAGKIADNKLDLLYAMLMAVQIWYMVVFVRWLSSYMVIWLDCLRIYLLRLSDYFMRSDKIELNYSIIPAKVPVKQNANICIETVDAFEWTPYTDMACWNNRFSFQYSENAICNTVWAQDNINTVVTFIWSPVGAPPTV